MPNSKDEQERLRGIIEEFNRRALRDELTTEEQIRIKQLLPQIEQALKVHDRAKWIIRVILTGIPILLALWQLVDRMHLW